VPFKWVTPTRMGNAKDLEVKDRVATIQRERIGSLTHSSGKLIAATDLGR